MSAPKITTKRLAILLSFFFIIICTVGFLMGTLIDRQNRNVAFTEQMTYVLGYFDEDLLPAEEDFEWYDEGMSYAGDASVVIFDEYYEILYIFVEGDIRFTIDIYVDYWDSRSTTISYIWISYFDDGNENAVTLSYYEDTWLSSDYVNHRVDIRPQVLMETMASADLETIQYFLAQIGYPVV